jgi:hypothetical protein
VQVVNFETTLGTVPVWGRFDTFDRSRPLLLVIRGFTPDPSQLVSMPDRLPGADVMLASLPGLHSPGLADVSLAAFSRAFDEVADALGRAVVVLGVSLGGLVALGLRSAWVRSVVALDPPLSSAALWPIADQFEASGVGAEWLRAVCGVGVPEPVSYRGALDGLRVPALVLLGGEPHGPRLTDGRLPSLVSADDRMAYEVHPMVTTKVLEGVGHNIPVQGLAAMMGALRGALGISFAPAARRA